MSSKAPLALMEQAVMILVFALAAALCMRVFVWSDQASKRGQALDRAVVEVQNAAEAVKAEGGRTRAGLSSMLDAAANAAGLQPDTDGGSAVLSRLYNENWEPCQARDAVWRLAVEEEPSDVPGLAWARVYVEDIAKGEVLFEATVAWQTEVGE